MVDGPMAIGAFLFLFLALIQGGIAMMRQGASAPPSILVSRAITVAPRRGSVWRRREEAVGYQLSAGEGDDSTRRAAEVQGEKSRVQGSGNGLSAFSGWLGLSEAKPRSSRCRINRGVVPIASGRTPLTPADERASSASAAMEPKAGQEGPEIIPRKISIASFRRPLTRCHAPTP